MEMTKIEIDVPSEIIQFVVTNDAEIQKKRNALLLYPYIENRTISYGKAAELLGMRKIDLINLYGTMGIAYFMMDIAEVEKDLQTIKSLRGKAV